MVRLNKWNREKLHFPILWFTSKAMFQGSSRIPIRNKNEGTLKPVIFVCGTKDKPHTANASAVTIFLGGATGIATIFWANAHKSTLEFFPGSQFASCFYAGQTLHITHGAATVRDQYTYAAWGIAIGVPREPA